MGAEGTNQPPNAPAPPETAEKGKKIKEDIDKLLDEIDDILEENAADFVESFRTRGGQGWSSFVDPQFFIGAAVASMLGNMAYDVFKGLIARVFTALGARPIQPDGRYDGDFEERLHMAWVSAQEVLDRASPVHGTVEQAAALHWTLFFVEFTKVHRLVQLPPEIYQQVRSAAVTVQALTQYVGEFGG